MPRPTIKDVAEAAGVSVATVSRALSGARGVRPEHKSLVIRTADAMGYRPHSIAQALRRSRTGAIGMVIPRIDNPFFPQLVAEAERALHTRGFSLLLCSSDDDPAIEAARIEVLLDRQVDGLLISASSQEDSAAAISAAALKVPTVQFDQRAPAVATPFVGIDDAAAMAQLVALLIGNGSQRLAYIGAGHENWSGLRRSSGFEQSARALDPGSPARMQLGEFTRDYGRQAAHRLLQEDPSIDAIVCGNDLIAIGVLDAARELNLKVPHDLQVTGFDDINVATVSNPALTTVRQPVTRIVDTAVEILLTMISGTPSDTVVELPVELVVRGSALR